MSQRRALSLAEALTNVALGYGLAVALQLVLFPAYGVALSLDQNLQIGAAFLAVSLLRSYLLRRLFARFGG